MNGVRKYRKKPVVIEAIHWHGNIEALFAFCPGLCISSAGQLFINTTEGVMLVSPNDYIVKGVKGEFYAVKPDIFKMTYEEV